MSWFLQNGGSAFGVKNSKAEENETKGLLNPTNIKIKESVCDSYNSEHMTGLVFYKYRNIIFPCTSYLPGEIVIFSTSNLSNTPSYHDDAIRRLCTFSHAMKVERVVAGGFTLKHRKLRFTKRKNNNDDEVSNKNDANFGKHQYINDEDKELVKRALELHFNIKIELS